MTPLKALELVERYSRLHHAIEACGGRIGACLELCKGQGGWRKETESNCGFDGDSDPIDAPTERAMADKTHLPLWYKPELIEDTREWGDSHITKYREIGPAEQAECPHCYAAHLVIQERKAMRRQMGALKGAMTKSTKAPDA